MLGHAIEYLVDSRKIIYRRLPKADVQAIKLMVRLNQEVFNECPEVVPALQHLRQWLMHLVVKPII